MDAILRSLSAKGGAGKTTVARELAAAGVLAGRQVALVDLDPQLGLTGWYGRREQEAPRLVVLPSEENLRELADAGIDELIIDLPPGVPPGCPRLIAKADVCPGPGQGNAGRPTGGCRHLTCPGRASALGVRADPDAAPVAAGGWLAAPVGCRSAGSHR